MRPTWMPLTTICWTRTMTEAPEHGRTHILTLRSAALVMLLTLIAGVSGASHHLSDQADPNIASTGFDLGAHARLLLDYGDLDALFSYRNAFETDRGDLSQSLMAGVYFRVHRNLKLGAFYGLSLGQRHDDDWIEVGSSWLWRDTALRPEHSLIADATPRFLVPFLPGRDWVFAVKTRYEFTLYSEGGDLITRNTALVRPGLTWFLIRDRVPLLNLSLHYATYLSLDFGTSWWYRHGPYLNVGYHLSPFLMADLSLGTNWVFWSESEAFSADFPDATYEDSVYRPWTIFLGVVYRPRG